MVGFYPRGADKTEFWINYWKMLHLVTYLYPEIATDRDKEQITALANRLSTHLPYKCKRCIAHYRANLIKYPLSDRYGGREQLTKWLIDIHNSVNSSKRKRRFSYAEVDALYNDVGQVNQSLVDAYGLDIAGYLADTKNDWKMLVHIAHRKIIDKIIARHEARRQATLQTKKAVEVVEKKVVEEAVDQSDKPVDDLRMDGDDRIVEEENDEVVDDTLDGEDENDKEENDEEDLSEADKEEQFIAAML